VRMVRLADLPKFAQERYHRQQEEKNLARLNAPPDPMKQPLVAIEKRRTHAVAKRSHPMLDFQPKIPAQEAIDQAVAGVPAAKRIWVEQWCELVAMLTNGTWQKYKGSLVGGRAVETKGHLRAWIADQRNISQREITRKVALYRKIKQGPGGRDDEKVFRAFVKELLPKPRPGRTSIFQREGNEWMWLALRNFYVNEAQFSMTRAHRMLWEECDSKQRAWKLGHLYEKPTLRQCQIALKNVSAPELTLGRLGNKAYNDKCAPYISRDPESLRSNDVWVTDQKQVDVRLRGKGEQLGRIWMVSFVDARSWKVMGYWPTTVLSSDTVMSAAAVAIGRHGVPRAILMDLGKEFACTAFSGSFRKIKGESLLREAQGLCQRLNIDVIKAIGRNPQTKPIERWHRECARFDHTIPGWCGSNTDERPEVLAEFERQHESWKQGNCTSTPLWTIQQYIHAFVSWIENDWNAGHRGRGKYLRGMTPDECWNTHAPPEGIRRITAAQLDMATADHRVLKVARGGQINITLYGQTIEYQAPELFLRQGQELEVILSRRSLGSITILDKASDGRFLCEAQAKPMFHWGLKAPEEREDLRQWIRRRNAARRAISLGNAARRVLEVTATPIEIGSQHPPLREISSTEFKARKLKAPRAPRTLTAGELARRALELQGE
jgi:plasmid stabilization system protein ParE